MIRPAALCGSAASAPVTTKGATIELLPLILVRVRVRVRARVRVRLRA
jgi:hypothetical protein